MAPNALSRAYTHWYSEVRRCKHRKKQTNIAHTKRYPTADRRKLQDATAAVEVMQFNVLFSADVVLPYHQANTVTVRNSCMLQRTTGYNVQRFLADVANLSVLRRRTTAQPCAVCWGCSLLDTRLLRAKNPATRAIQPQPNHTGT